MRFSNPVRMADGDTGPVWSRTKRRRGSAPIVGIIVTLLALFGAVTIGLSVKEKSVAGAGGVIDGWISSAWNGARKIVGQAPEVAEKAADDAGDAAARTGDALQAGAEKTAEELRQP